MHTVMTCEWVQFTPGGIRPSFQSGRAVPSPHPKRADLQKTAMDTLCLKQTSDQNYEIVGCWKDSDS